MSGRRPGGRKAAAGSRRVNAAAQAAGREQPTGRRSRKEQVASAAPVALIAPPPVALPVVAILGRPNVGKSTLFNRLVGREEALVEDRPGVTRDRHYGEGEWDGRHFSVVDTGGFLEGEIDLLAASVRRQAEKALSEAAIVLLVVDARQGLTADDEVLADVVRRSGKPAFLVANKMDDSRSEARSELSTVYGLGFAEVFAVSAAHGRGVNDLLDAVLERLPDAPRGEREFDAGALADDGIPRIAVVGRPNAGKSTLLNQLLGEERLVVSAVPGTTRDAIEVELVRGDRRYKFIDTAGIRRRVGHGDDLEQESAGLAEESLQRADVVIVLFDATEPAVEQDARLLGEALKWGKPLVLAANKMDLLDGAGRTALRDAIGEHLRFVFVNAPIVEISAQRGNGLGRLLEVCTTVFEQSLTRIPTPEINRFLGQAEDSHPAPRHGGHLVRLYYMAQVSVRPPTFLIHVNRPAGITEAYRRFLENSMRERWGFQIPLRLVFRGRGRKH